MYGGAVGGGKTDGLLGDFLKQSIEHPGAARGIFFRGSFPELEEPISRSKEIFQPLGWVWREKDKMWVDPHGSTLKMRFCEKPDDWRKYWGHQYTWQGWDEAGNIADPSQMDKLYARLRSPHGVPCRRRLTANPGGPGHGWLKTRYVDPAPPNTPFKAVIGEADGKQITVDRVFIPSKLKDNLILCQQDPNYAARLYAVGNKALVDAWLSGSWDVPLGQYFVEWSGVHVIPEHELPKHWLRFCSLDWGSKTPFCVGWYAVSDGEGFPKGALIKYREWYGGTGNRGLELSAKDVARGIRTREAEKISYRVADYQIFRSDGGPSIAEEMGNCGVHWKAADKERKAGWQQIRLRLKGEGFGTELWRPMLYVMSNCTETVRTFPLLQHDEKDPEDVYKAKGVEDHAGDETRYACMSRPYSVQLPGRVRKKGFTLFDLLNMQKKPEHRLRGY